MEHIPDPDGKSNFYGLIPAKRNTNITIAVEGYVPLNISSAPTEYVTGTYYPVSGTYYLAYQTNVTPIPPSGPIPINTCTTISSPGVYMLSQNLSSSSTCITIESSDVVFGGMGHSITGSGSNYGIYVYKNGTTLTNVTVKNVTVTGWQYGIYYRGVENGNIENNTANLNKYGKGIYLTSSSSNTITGNTAWKNDDGITFESSSNNTLTNNTASNNGYGILLLSSSSNLITDNTASNNYNGIALWSSSNNTLTDNTANSNINYGIWLYRSSNNNLTNNTASNNDKGIYLYFSSYNNTLTNNTVSSNNWAGIYLHSSSNNTLTDNTANLNYYHGIYLVYSRGNTIYNNFFNNTNNFGFYDTGYTNSWNTSKTPSTNVIGGPYLGGNFWANPDGTGFSETCTDNDVDGICDSNYTLTSGNVDNLPLAVVPPSINISKVMTSGKTTVYTQTMEYWVIEIEVINDGLTNLSNVVVSDTIPEEITLDDFTTSKGTAAAAEKNGATKLTWAIGTMSPGDVETLVMGISTKRLRSGRSAAQPFLEPGEYVLNQGASVSANGGRVTAGPTDPITVYAKATTGHGGRMGGGRHSR